MIKKSYHLKAPLSQIWHALVDPKTISQWSGSKATMDAKTGGKFKLWDGSIWGTNTKLEKEKTIEQDWFGGEWDEPSKVIIRLKGSKGLTIVELEHTGVPSEEEPNFDSGWDQYYFGPLKELVENSIDN